MTAVLPDRERAQWLTQLQHVIMALNQCLYSITSSYYCRDDLFEIVAAMDSMCIIFVNTSCPNDSMRYRVYTPNVVYTCATLPEMTAVIHPFRESGTNIRGVAFGNTHFCALYPATEEPNFAGDYCIGQWD